MTTSISQKIIRAINMLPKEDRQYLLGQIEKARWMSGPTYNEGTHILMDVLHKMIKNKRGD